MGNVVNRKTIVKISAQIIALMFTLIAPSVYGDDGRHNKHHENRKNNPKITYAAVVSNGTEIDINGNWLHKKGKVKVFLGRNNHPKKIGTDFPPLELVWASPDRKQLIVKLPPDVFDGTHLLTVMTKNGFDEYYLAIGAQGPSGLPGPPGPKGDPGGLALANQTCPQGHSVIGFDADSNIICAIPSASIIDCINIVPGAALTGCDLSGDDLTGLNLNNTKLNFANLSGANISGVSLIFSSLGGTNLNSANLSGAILNFANLVSASLINANLTGAGLKGANLTNANLTGANLTGANLTDVTWSSTICPDGTNSDDNGGTCAGNL